MDKFLILFGFLLARQALKRDRSKRLRNPVVKLRNGWEIDRDRLTEIMTSLCNVLERYPKTLLCLAKHCRKQADLKPEEKPIPPEHAAILSEFQLMQRKGIVRIAVRKVVQAAVRVRGCRLLIDSPFPEPEAS